MLAYLNQRADGTYTRKFRLLAKEKAPYNFVSLGMAREFRKSKEIGPGFLNGGRFMIPTTEKLRFINALTSSVPRLGESLVPVARGVLTPLVVDIDLQFEKESCLGHEDIHKFIERHIALINRPATAVFIFKRKPYEKLVSKKQWVCKDGFHAYFLDAGGKLYSSREMIAIRDRALAENLVEDCFGHLNPLNSAAEIYDDCLCTKRNWAMLPLCSKPWKGDRTGYGGGPLMPVYACMHSEDGYDVIPDEAIAANFETGLPPEFAEAAVEWAIVREPDPTNTLEACLKKAKKAKKKAKRKKQPTFEGVNFTTPRDTSPPSHVSSNDEDGFVLAEFLDVTSDHVPSHAEYLQIIAYLASLSIDPTAAQELTNDAWGYDNDETMECIQKVRDAGDFRVHRGTIELYLQKYGKKGWKKRCGVFKDRRLQLEIDNMTFEDGEDLQQLRPLSEVVAEFSLGEKRALEESPNQPRKRRKLESRALVVYDGEIQEVGDPPESEEKIDTTNPDGFNLEAYLESLPDWKPSKPDFIDICIYCVKLGLDALLPRVYGFFGERVQPWVDEVHTEQLRSRRGYAYKVTKGSIQYRLTTIGVDWKVKGIWPTPRFTRYADYEPFLIKNGKAFFRQDAVELGVEVCVFANKRKLFVYREHETIEDISGRVFRHENLRVDKDMPWTGTDDFRYNQWPEPPELFEFAKRNAARFELDEEKLRVLFQITRAARTTTPAMLQGFLNMKIDVQPKPTKMSSVMHDIHMDGLLRRYNNIDFFPFLRVDPTSDDVFNTFEGFPLAQIPPILGTFNIEETNIYKWLTEVLCAGHADSVRFFLGYLSFILQKPHIRAERMFFVICKEQGVGKSTLLYLFQALVGESLCCTCPGLAQLIQHFNGRLRGKILIFIDDTEAATKRQAAQLKSRTTLKTMPYNTKHEKIQEFRCTDDLWFTSNEETPLYLREEDRRPVYFNVNGKYFDGMTSKQKNEFFTKLYAELASTPIMKGIFDHFANADIGPFSPRDDVQVNPEGREKQIANNMRLSHRYVVDHFTNVDFYKAYLPSRATFEVKKEWSRNFTIGPLKRKSNHFPEEEVGTALIRVTKDRFYQDYTKWVRQNCPRSKAVAKSTFVKEVELLGLEAKRAKINKVKRVVYFLFPARVTAAFKKIYRSGCPRELEDWVTQNQESFEQAQIGLKNMQDMLEPMSF